MKPTTVMDSLLQDHAELELMFTEVVDAAEAGVDHRTMCALWASFEQTLLDHLDAEERYLLPALEPDHPAEVAALRWEHEEIRMALDRLDVAVQLHEVREQAVVDFIAKMRAHAAREGEGAYRWAEQALSAQQRRGLLERSRAA